MSYDKNRIHEYIYIYIFLVDVPILAQGVGPKDELIYFFTFSDIYVNDEWISILRWLI